MSELNSGIKISRVSASVAAGQTAVNGSSVNMAGFDGVMFIGLVGAITATAVTAMKAQQSSDDGSADGFSDIEGSAQSIADDDDTQGVVLDIFRPGKQYVRPVITRATADSVVDGILAIQYAARRKPTTHQAASIVSSLILASPAEGTA